MLCFAVYFELNNESYWFSLDTSKEKYILFFEMLNSVSTYVQTMLHVRAGPQPGEGQPVNSSPRNFQKDV